MISINVTPTGTQPSEGSVSSAVVNDKIDKKIESFKTETFDAPLVTAPVGDEVIPVKRPDESFGTIQINQLGSGTSTVSVIEATYDELVSLADSGKLIPGQKYRMIDYETVIEGDGIRSAGHPFDLIVTALSETTLNKKCSAAHSIRDIDGYFLNSDLSSWEIYYTLDSSLYSHVPIKGKGAVVDLLGVGEEYPMYLITLMCKPQSDGTFLWSGVLNAKDIMGITLIAEVVTSDETLDSAISLNMCMVEEDICETLDSSMIGEIPIVKEFNNEFGGTGYIYRLTDEFNNSCPYDFKNVQYLVSLIDTSYGRSDETGLRNGWKFNYTNNTDASDQWVYTFNRQDYEHEYHDVSLNYNQRDLTCVNNYMSDSAQLPKNIILTSDEVAERGSDGEPEAERVMNNNYFGYMCFNNIFNICSDTTFKENCSENVGCGLYKNTLNNVGRCVFDNTYMIFTNSKLEQCYNCKFTRVVNCDLYHMQNGTNDWLTNSTIQYVNSNLPMIEECVIKSWTNVSGTKLPRIYNSTVNLRNITIQNQYTYYYVYNSNINISNCTWTVSGGDIYNLDAIIDGVDFSTIRSAMMYVPKYKTFVRSNLDNEICIYTELDLFNQAGASYLVDALNTAI